MVLETAFPATYARALLRRVMVRLRAVIDVRCCLAACCRVEVAATALYGYRFACAFQKGNIYGTQFHPEKSHKFGMKVLQNFAAIQA